MPAESGGICGRLTSDLPLSDLQGGREGSHLELGELDAVGVAVPQALLELKSFV